MMAEVSAPTLCLYTLQPLTAARWSTVLLQRKPEHVEPASQDVCVCVGVCQCVLHSLCVCVCVCVFVVAVASIGHTHTDQKSPSDCLFQCVLGLILRSTREEGYM